MIVLAVGVSLSPFSSREAIAAPGTIDAGGGKGRMKSKTGNATLYRPKAKVVSPSSETVFETSNPVVPMVVDYRVISGFVAKIDMIVNGKKVQTIPIPGAQSSGRVKISYDFSKWGPGLHKVKLEPVNGSPGHQNSRGRSFLPSLKVKLNP